MLGVESEIEVEARAELSEADRQHMIRFMGALGTVQEVRRVTIDFSGPDRERTAMLRIQDGSIQLITKTGGLTEQVRRSVVCALSPATSLASALALMRGLGYSRASVALRTIYIVRSAEWEYSLRDVLSIADHAYHTTLLEVEALDVQPGEEAEALQGANDEILRHGLAPLKGAAWESWVRTVEAKVDRPFEYDSNNPVSVEELERLIQQSGAFVRPLTKHSTSSY